MQEMTTTTTKKMGRASKYETHVQPFLDDILIWLRDGMNEYSICDKLGISKETWISYKDTHLDLSDLYKRACEERNCLVANAVFNGSLGHKAVIKKQKVLQSGTVVDFEEEEYIAPDMNAAKFWLTNRDSENWQDKGQKDTSISVNFQLPELQQQRNNLLSEIEKLKAIDMTEVEVIPDDKKQLT